MARNQSLKPVSDSLPLWEDRKAFDRMAQARQELASLATARITAMFGCYQKDDVADPEVFITAAVAILIGYDRETIIEVTDPAVGLPVLVKWFPKLFEVKEQCDRIQAKHDKKKEWEDRKQKTEAMVAASVHEQEERKARPTYEQMKERAGANWGIDNRNEEDEHYRGRIQFLERTNKVFFENECKKAGMSPDSPISPALAKLLGVI